MPDNSNSIMVVLDFKGNTPAGWTAFPGDDLIARRVAWSDFRKLVLNGKKAVLLKTYEVNPSGPNPLATEYSGDDDYSVMYDVVNDNIECCRHNASGGNSGTIRNTFSPVPGVQPTEDIWPKDRAQVPMQGMTVQDKGNTGSQLTAAQALNTDSVPLG